MEKYHRLLKRQIAKHINGEQINVEDLTEFLDSVNQAYIDYQNDFEQLERTLEISSNELFKTNSQLNAINEQLEEKVHLRTKELELANQTLLAEVYEKEKREIEKAFSENLLDVSNNAINQLISIDLVQDSFSEIFKPVADAAQMDDILYCLNEGYPNSPAQFSIQGRYSKNEETNIELVTRLFHVLNDNFKLIEKVLGRNRPFFLRELEKIVDPGITLNQIGSFKNLVCPIVIKGKIHSVVVFHHSKGRIWSTLEQGILARLSDSTGNLVHQKALERDIQYQQKSLLEAQQFSNIGSFEIDFVKTTSSFTQKAAELLDITIEELAFDSSLVHRLRKHVHPDDLKMIDETWQRSMNNKAEVRIDFRVIHRNGRVLFLNWNLKPRFSSQGNLKSVKGTLQDITERMLLEQKSKTAQLIIENSPSVLFRWKVQEGWPVEYVSSNIQQFGYSTEEFTTQERNYSEIIHEEDYPRIINEIEEYSKNSIRTYQQEYRIVCKDGRIRWVQDQTLTEADQDGHVNYHQGIITDITEKKEALLALEEREIRFRNLIQNSSDITTILDGSGVIEYESTSFYRLFNYSPEQIIGKSAFEFIHPDDLQKVIQAFTDLYERPGGVSTVLFRFKNAESGWKYLEAIATNLLFEPSISGIVVNSRDVDERILNELQLKDYANSLEKINKELDQFAYIVSHDLKAPLRAINNLSIWIEEDLVDIMPEDTKKNITMLRGRIGRMEALINGILEYSRAGRMKAETIQIDMNVFVQDVVFNLAPPDNFKVEIQENLPVLNTEKVALEQVVSNFISNAIKYNSNPEPVIRVGYEDRGAFHCFYVEDNGPGISKEFHEKVFAIFQTLQARDKVESTGVGLAIVKKIVEEKGGNAWLESEEGQGCRFYFTLPKTDNLL